MSCVIDNTIIDLTGLLVTSVGIFSVLTKKNIRCFNDEELSSTFLNSNPFLLKKEIVESTANIVFTTVALLGFAIQACSAIFESSFRGSQYSWQGYLLYLLFGMAVSWPITIWLGLFSVFISKSKWLPVIIDNQRAVYSSVAEILRNKGFRDDQLKNLPTTIEAEKVRQKNANMETVEDRLTQLEKLLEIRSHKGSYEERLKKIEKLINQNATTLLPAS